MVFKDNKKCINCDNLVTKESFPFCSPRCRNLDLYRWMSGQYVIPGESVNPSDLDKD